MSAPQPRYAKTIDEVNIVYQVLGEGAHDIVYIPGFASHLEYAWGHPWNARFLRHLSSFARLIADGRRARGDGRRRIRARRPTRCF